MIAYASAAGDVKFIGFIMLLIIAVIAYKWLEYRSPSP